MKKNLDIYLGLAAWLMALPCLTLEIFNLMHVPIVFFTMVIPSLWLCAVGLMLIFRNRPLRKLWWVWFSLPFAYAPYVALIIYDIDHALRRL